MNSKYSPSGHYTSKPCCSHMSACDRIFSLLLWGSTSIVSQQKMGRSPLSYKCIYDLHFMYNQSTISGFSLDVVRAHNNQPSPKLKETPLCHRPSLRSSTFSPLNFGTRATTLSLLWQFPWKQLLVFPGDVIKPLSWSPPSPSAAYRVGGGHHSTVFSCISCQC